MNNFFNLDTPHMRFLAKVGDLITLNFLFLLCSLPVITIGPALSAISRVMYELSKHPDTSVIKIFFSAFKENFKKSTIVWILSILSFLAMIAHLCLIQTIHSDILRTVLFSVWLLISALIIATLSYIFPLMMHYENTLKLHLQNSVLLAIGQLPRTILLILLNAFPITLFLFLPAVFFYLIIPLVQLAKRLA